MTTYLIFSDLTSAQSRSHQRATEKGCVGETIYWWAQVEHPNGQAALVIDDAGDFDSSGLSLSETAVLQTHVALAAQGWFPVVL